MRKRNHKRSAAPLLLLLLLAGGGLLLYPGIAQRWNSFYAARVVSDYQQALEKLDPEDFTEEFIAAEHYNEQLYEGTAFTLTEEQQAEYLSLLNVQKDGLMGKLEIPVLGLTLPIYHGVEEDTLQSAVGHLAWSSLPVGGESTHCILSGHRGLPGAKLFSNLDAVQVGDIFILSVLDRELTYQVDSIFIIEPDDGTHLQIEDGEDYCTLLTCTPYGVNTHRLLVRGRRIENLAETQRITILANASPVEPVLVGGILLLPILIISLLVAGRMDRRGRRRRRRFGEAE